VNITTFSDYSLRVLTYVTTFDDRKTTAQEIADTYDISFHHVAKAAQWLTQNGYLKSVRGRNGGITLNQAADAIKIGDLLRKTEAESPPMVECLNADGGQCCIRSACGLKMALIQAQSAFYTTLNKFSLADIVGQKTALAKLLSQRFNRRYKRAGYPL